MAPFRLRHPKGVSTIQLDPESATVQDLLQAIFAVSEIPPSAQDRTFTTIIPISLTSFTSHSLRAVKAGYPPRALTAVIPELPLSSLGLAPSDQLIVVQKSGSASAAAPTSSSSSSPSSPGRTTTAARPTHGTSSNLPRQAVASTPALSATIESEDDGRGRPDYVTMDGGYLIHRVRTTRLQVVRPDLRAGGYLLFLFFCADRAR
jgi:ubiquitin thioesterase OTU1